MCFSLPVLLYAQIKQQLAQIVGNHDAQRGVGDALHEEVDAQHEIGDYEERGACYQQGIPVPPGGIAHTQQQYGIDGYAAGCDAVRHPGEYPAHGRSVEECHDAQQYYPEGQGPRLPGRHQQAQYNNVRQLCEGEEGYLWNQFVLPAHHVAQEGEEECSRQRPLPLPRGAQGEPAQGENHPGGKGHGHKVQHRQENEDGSSQDVPLQFHRVVFLRKDNEKVTYFFQLLSRNP